MVAIPAGVEKAFQFQAEQARGPIVTLVVAKRIDNLG